jgi:hypothetical protein
VPLLLSKQQSRAMFAWFTACCGARRDEAAATTTAVATTGYNPLHNAADTAPQAAQEAATAAVEAPAAPFDASTHRLFETPRYPYAPATTAPTTAARRRLLQVRVAPPCCMLHGPRACVCVSLCDGACV